MKQSTVAYVHQTRAHMTHGVRVEMMAILSRASVCAPTFALCLCVYVDILTIVSCVSLCKLQVPWSTLHKLYTHRQFTYQRNKKIANVEKEKGKRFSSLM